MLGLVLLAQGRSKFRLGVPHPVTLVDDDVLPLQLAEGRLIVENVLVGREDDVELLVLEELREGRPLVLLALVCDDTNRGRPLLELVNPVLDGH